MVSFQLRNIWLASGIILLLAFLFLKTISLDSAAHQQFSSHLSRINELYATLNQNILELRYDLLGYYGPIVAEFLELKNFIVSLKKFQVSSTMMTGLQFSNQLKKT
jgi:hypothetical protein